ncbi:MAG: methyl-accepting chemotaxis protein, partial [Prochloraceae cyanobacterium]
SISSSLEAQSILDTAVEEIHDAIKSDRVVVYELDENDKSIAIAKSTQSNWSIAQGEQIANPCFDANDIEKYQQGWVQNISDIYQANLSQERLKQLEFFCVKAYLVAPILIGGELRELLVAHQCSSERNWGQTEIDLFRQVAAQVGLALERVDLLEQQRLSEKKQRRAKESLQRGALQLLKDIAPVSRGDLTVRAHVGSDEIGTIAGSYNSIIEDLRKIVFQVQTAAQQLSSTTKKNESVVEALSEGALRQSGEISLALSRIQAMVASIQAVAINAEQAEVAVQEAAQTVQEGDRAMNRTVEGMMAIQEKVIETAEKIKSLGQTSQKISQVVNLISSFAQQTKLLALNASIEAAHAGKKGLGFGAVADQVGLLAQQSAKATVDIEKLVTEIQKETNEVVVAMQAGTEQVAAETKMVTKTRQTLYKITEASYQINHLVDEIAQATEEQSQASNVVYPTMVKAAGIVSQTSTLAAEVSASFKELLTLAEDLQESVGQFKVS